MRTKTLPRHERRGGCVVSHVRSWMERRNRVLNQVLETTQAWDEHVILIISKLIWDPITKDFTGGLSHSWLKNSERQTTSKTSGDWISNQFWYNQNRAFVPRPHRFQNLI
jgi:hypothetical protein